MQFELKTISTKIFLIIVMPGAIITVLGSLLLGISLHNKSILVVSLVLMFSATIYLAHIAAFYKTIVLISDNILQINNQKILFDNVKGYFINEGITMTSFEIKLNSSEVVSITGLTVGEHGKKFRNFMSEMIRIVKLKDRPVEELTYQDMHVREMKFIKPILYIAIPSIIIIDLVVLYLIFTKGYFPWQILFVNLLFLKLIPLLKQNK